MEELGNTTLDSFVDAPQPRSPEIDVVPPANTDLFEEVPSIPFLPLKSMDFGNFGRKCTCDEYKGTIKRIEARLEEMAHTQQIMLKKIIHLEYLMPMENLATHGKCYEKNPENNPTVSEVNKIMSKIKKETYESHEHSHKTKTTIDLRRQEKSKRIVDISSDEDYDFDSLAHMKSRVKTSSTDSKDDVAMPTMTSFAQTEKEKVYGKMEKFEYKSQSPFYRRGSVDKETEDSTSHTNTKFMGKKLVYVDPVEDSSCLKVPKSETKSKLTPMKRSNSSVYASTEPVRKDKAHGRKAPTKNTQTVIQTRFKPTKDMNLTDEQAKLSAYIFYVANDPSEVVFKCRGVVGTLKEFGCLAPDRGINEEIINFMATKTMATQMNVKNPTIWCFPPSFHHDILSKKENDELKNIYLKDWMPQFTDIKYIYVPIEEVGGHWYLMVISLVERVVYHLDSLLGEKNVNPRHFHMGKVCDALSKLVGCDEFPPDYGNGLVEVPNWEINEKVVRMKVAMDLLCGEHNECWNSLQANVTTFWQRLT
ncbi:Ulp1 protease family, C-terminal catalytic domain [Sesbania bispinosa]|nr:Ulp1 protease family, C-terminal catalytic domain [Sesbania bispinosa]